MIVDYHSIPPFPFPDAGEPHAVHVVIETPRGSGNKFSYNEEYGLMELSRVMRAGLKWPYDFGMVPQTLGDDGDALDALLLLEDPTFPGCLVRARALGVIGLVKNGETNDRLIVCPTTKSGSGSVWDEVRDLGDLSARRLRELEAFLRDYNTFEGHSIQLTGQRGADAAMRAVGEAHLRWKSAR